MSDQIRVTLVRAGQKKTFRIRTGALVETVLERAAKNGFDTANCTVKEGTEGGRKVSLKRALDSSITLYLTANIDGGSW